MTVSWEEFKAIIDQMNGKHMMSESESAYSLSVNDNGITINCKIDRDPSDTSTLDDYEDFYLQYANQIAETFYQREPFASKKLASGASLYRRKHGKRVSCAANSETNIDMVIPYDNCRINKIEVINANMTDLIDLKVLDTPTGTFSTIPNYVLNQFGFNVVVCDLLYSDKSDYDAALIKDMTVRAVYKNDTDSARLVGVNFVLHEVVE